MLSKIFGPPPALNRINGLRGAEVSAKRRLAAPLPPASWGAKQGDCISKQGQEPGEVGFVPTGSLELAPE